ncbi:MAG: hypothetical protein O9284_17980 [Steroidobacteraceae bacterium]|nr:hypothetical protein [Steroidobacteraceae bacterium]
MKNPKSVAEELASAWRGYEWAGVTIGDHQARFWSLPPTTSGRAIAALTDLVCSRTRFPAFNFSEPRLMAYITRLKESGADYAYGFVSLLREIGEFSLRSGQQLPKVKCVITTAEKLDHSDRALIESAFRTRVYDEYGCGELGTIAHECERGSLHIAAENLIVEVLDNDGRPATDVLGEITVTDLTNRAMPLIRYRTGDLGVLSSVACVCGRELPVLREVTGRAYDVISNPAGTRFHGSFFTGLFAEAKKNGMDVRGFQVVQLAPERLHIKVVPTTNENDLLLAFVRKNVRERFHPDTEVEFEYVAAIPRERSGKIRLVKKSETH